MATKIIGLDLGTHSVKLCEMVSTFRNFELVGYGTENVVPSEGIVPSLEDIAQAAHTVLERRGLLGETVICSLPPGLASTAILELPFEQPKKIEAVLPFQLDEAIPLDIDDIVYDYQVIKRHDGGGATVLCAYVRQRHIEALLEALEAQGIDPKEVSMGALTHYNLYEYCYRTGSGASQVLLDLGHQHSTLSILSEDGPSIVRDMSVGGLSITRAIAAAFQLEPVEAEQLKVAEASIGSVQAAEAGRAAMIDEACRRALTPLVTELRRTLASHEMRTGENLDTIFVTGGTSQLPGLIDYLTKALHIRVVAFQPLHVGFNRLQIDRERHTPFAAKSLALATQAFARQYRNQINFRKGSLSYTGDFGFMRGRMIAIALTVLTMIALGSTAAITKKRVLEAEHAQLQSQAIKLSKSLLSVESDDVDLLLATVAETRSTGGKGVPETSAFEILSHISETIDLDLKVDVDRLELDLDRKNLVMRGKTGSAGDVERIVDAIRKTKCFKEVKKERNEQSVDERRRFRVSATSTCG